MCEISLAADNPNPVQFTPELPQTNNSSCPFEGPEKLLEIWFHPAPLSTDLKSGLRTIDRHDWEDMLDVVKCKVLSVINGREMDAYLLSESSFFVFPHKLILKTCGTTLNLLGLPLILEIAAKGCGFHHVWRCFYSRKSFMFPERQCGPHREWREEVEYLDKFFPDQNGAAYTVGKVNGDHWLLYMTAPPENSHFGLNSEERYNLDTSSLSSSVTLPSLNENDPMSYSMGLDQDYTIEILMTHLAAPARDPFFFLEEEDASDSVPEDEGNMHATTAHSKGASLSSHLGISSIFPKYLTKLDSYAFTPCGYSANAIISYDEKVKDDDQISSGEGYYTIHVTPEEGWSYASFECNVPLIPSCAISHPTMKNPLKDTKDKFPDLKTLIQRVVDIFQPGTLTLTLFVSSPPPLSPYSSPELSGSSLPFENDGERYPLEVSDVQVCLEDDIAPLVETAQKSFKQALVPRGYKRMDKINYEIGGYDLAFATFQRH